MKKILLKVWSVLLRIFFVLGCTGNIILQPFAHLSIRANLFNNFSRLSTFEGLCRVSVKKSKLFVLKFFKKLGFIELLIFSILLLAEASVLAAKPRKVIRWVTPVSAAHGQRKAVQSKVQRIAYCMIECQPRVTGLVLGLGRCAH